VYLLAIVISVTTQWEMDKTLRVISTAKYVPQFILDQYCPVAMVVVFCESKP